MIASANGQLTSARLLYRYGVLSNDTDVDGDILTTLVVTGPAHGALTLNTNGTFTYTHDGSNFTTDSFTYRAVDAAGNSNLATVTFTITIPTNNPPVGVNNSYSLAEGGTLAASDGAGTIPGVADGVLVNDSDPEGQPLTAVLVSNPAHGTLTFNAIGTFTYVHDGSENFNDSFTYRPHDGTQPGNLTTVNLTITPVNNAPETYRDVAHIPPEEIQAGMLLIIRHAVGIGVDSLIKETANVFGFNRTGNRIRDRLLKECKALQQKGAVTNVDGLLSCPNH